MSTYQRELIRFEFKYVILTNYFLIVKIYIENGEKFFKEIEKVNIELKSLNSINKILDSQNIRVLNSVEGIVKLKLFSELSLSKVITALLIIRNIYNQIKDLLEEEIKIIKIETGLLRCKILGNKIIIGMISAIWIKIYLEQLEIFLSMVLN